MLPLAVEELCNLLHLSFAGLYVVAVGNSGDALFCQSVQAEMMLIITTPESAARTLQHQQGRPDQQARTGWHHSPRIRTLLNLADLVAASDQHSGWSGQRPARQPWLQQPRIRQSGMRWSGAAG